MSRLTGAALALVAAVFLAGCGSSGDDATSSPTPVSTASPEERTYFGELQTAMQQLRQESTALADFRSHAFDPALSQADHEARAAEYGTRYAAFAADRQARLSAIAAPDSVKGFHSRLTDAASAVQQLSGNLTARLTAKPVSSALDLSALFIELDGATLEGRFRDACTDLQRRAAAGGLSAELACGS